jgi:PAS domain S-box-containing protein
VSCWNRNREVDTSWNLIRKAIEAGSFPDMELEIIRPDGTKRWLHTPFEVTPDSQGTVRNPRGVSRDITEGKQTGDQLRESESKLAAVVNSALDAIITVNKEQQIVLFNPAAEKMFQCSASEAVGTHLNRFIPPRFRAVHETHIKQFAEMGVTNRGIGQLGALSALRSNGEEFPMEASISRAESDGKKLFTVIIRDVTEQVRAEQALLESEQKFRRLIEHIGDAIAVDDVQGRVVFANDRFLKLFGFRPDEIGRINLEDYAAPEYRTTLRDRHERRMRALEEPGQDEYEGVRRDGGRVWLDASVVVIRDGEGKVVGSQKILRDVTLRTQVEHALRESEERFRLIANTAPVMIWMSGTDKLCNYFNRPWLEFTGRSLKSQLGDGWASGVHPEDASKCVQTYTEAFDQHRSFDMQYRLRRHDGQYRWVLDIGVPRFNPDGSFAGYIGSCIDITERKQVGETMASIGRRLIEAHEEERTRIGRELHDDINQRLALLAVELDRWKEVLPSSPQLLEYVHHAQQLIHEIARDVQSLSHRLHSSKLDYLGLPTAANSFCRELAENNGVNVKYSHAGVPRTIPKEVALCLFRVLQEALQNAVKHSGVKEFRVDLRGTSEAVELTVIDTGSGFDEHEAFTRQGLGLISMRERLQLVRGDLSVESHRGAGTTIRARVPLNRDELQAMGG